VPVGSGRVGADWWVRAPAAASAVPSAAKAAVLAEQRYRVLAAWIAGRNAVVGHLSTTAVINTLADGAGRDYLASLPAPVTAPEDQSKIYGETRWTIIGGATRNTAGYSVTTCQAESVRHGPPTPSSLRNALQGHIAVSSDLVVDENGTWLVLTPALSASTRIPPGCAAWAARLRRQAGLSK
jgi:hypothetical protein